MRATANLPLEAEIPYTENTVIRCFLFWGTSPKMPLRAKPLRDSNLRNFWSPELI